MLSMKQSLVIFMTLRLRLNFQILNATDKLKKAIREEFKYIKELLDFDKKVTRNFQKLVC